MQALRPLISHGFLRALVGLPLLLLASLASASVVYTQGHVTAETDVINTGALIVANNLGPSSPVTVNGVAFGNSRVGLSGMTMSGADFSNQFPSGSPLDQLLSGLDFQTGGYSYLNLGGLTVGTDYMLQLFIANPINFTGKTSRVTVQGQSYNVANFGNMADYINVEFTAQSVSELVTFGNGSANEGDRMVLNGYALHADNASVPAPGVIALMGLGLLGLGLSRQRR